MGSSSKNSLPSDWKSRRKEAFERDGFACQNCGRNREDHNDVELHAHHITPRNEGGGHQLSNLKTLCKECHVQTDSYGHPGGRTSKGIDGVTKVTIIVSLLALIVVHLIKTVLNIVEARVAVPIFGVYVFWLLEALEPRFTLFKSSRWSSLKVFFGVIITIIGALVFGFTWEGLQAEHRAAIILYNNDNFHVAKACVDGVFGCLGETRGMPSQRDVSGGNLLLGILLIVSGWSISYMSQSKIVKRVQSALMG